MVEVIEAHRTLLKNFLRNFLDPLKDGCLHTNLRPPT